MTRTAWDFGFLHKSWLIITLALSLAAGSAWKGEPKKEPAAGAVPSAWQQLEAAASSPSQAEQGRRERGQGVYRNGVGALPLVHSSSSPVALGFVKPNVSQTRLVSSPNKD